MSKLLHRAPHAARPVVTPPPTHPPRHRPQRHAGRHHSYALALLPLAFLLVVQIIPACGLVVHGVLHPDEGSSGFDLWLVWSDPYLRWRLLWSAIQAGVSCVAALILGVPLAWVLARWDFPARGLVLRLLMLPFVVPTLLAALGVLALLGPNGLLDQWCGLDMQGSPMLLLYGNLFMNLCVVVRTSTDALEHVSANQIAAARNLGATAWRAFWRVEWPAIAPWLMSALCLVFLYCFSGFGLALVLGGQEWATAEVEIYTLVAHELQLQQASALAFWVLLLTAVVALGYAVLERRLAAPSRSDALPRRAPRGWWQWSALLAALVLLTMVCGAPLLALVWRAAQASAATWSVLWQEETLQALANTLRFSAMALLLATLLGVVHALAARRWLVMRVLVFLPFVVPPVLVAFGLLLVYPSWSASLCVLLAAYTLLAYPFIAKSVAAALDSLPPHYTDAAATLGATPMRIWWRVTLPLLLPALRKGMAFAAATALGEFAVTLFLSRPEWSTITTLIYQYLGRAGAANLDAALVLCCLLMLVALLAFVLIEWDTKNSHSKHCPDHTPYA